MPEAAFQGSDFRFRPPPSVTLLVPVVVAFLIQVPATIVIAAVQRVPPGAGAASAALAAASALVLLAARRWPGPTVAVVAALAATDLFVPPDAGPPFVALAFAIVGAVVRGARTWALISVGAAWLIAIVTGGYLGVAWHPFRIAVTTLALAVCFAIGAAIRSRLDRGRAYRARQLERRTAAEQAERARIARELHDVLAHSLSQIAVQSGVGLHLFDREPERAREALASIRTLSATGLDEVRGVLGFLRGDTSPAPLSPQPQLADLPALVDQRSGLGLTITLDDLLDGAEPASSVQTTAFRIVQEALTNVVRHSAASSATVRLERVRTAARAAGAPASTLRVIVDDDGTGRGAHPAEGGGIRGMSERAQLAGGALTLSTLPSGGTRVHAELPWTEPQ